MPRSNLSAGRVLELLGRPVSPEELEALLFSSKAELEGRTDEALDLSVTPDRLDLLDEGGLALDLAGALGAARGGARLRRGRPSARGLSFLVDASVEPLRPSIAGVVVRAPAGRPLDEGLLTEVVRFQEVLHASVGRDRRAMSLGIYPAARLRGPIRYALEPLDSVSFVPLEGDAEVPAARFFTEHPLAARYGALGRTGDRCLTLRDARGEILSLPPVLNSRTSGQATPGNRVLLLESTGTRPRAVREGLGLLLVAFAARGWSVRPVPRVGPGDRADDGTSVLADRPVDLSASTLRGITGEDLRSAEVVDRLARARLSARRVRGGWRVGAPPWRPDLLAAVDVAEEVVLHGGLRVDAGVVPASPTHGRRRAEAIFRRRVSELLLGLGFAEPHTPFLVSEATVERLGGPPPIKLANPVSREFAFLRDRLLPSHLDVLAKNTRHGYPQRFAEVAPVVVRAPIAEAGGETRYRAGGLIAGEGAGFADAAATVDYLLRTLDVGSVREPAELPGTIPGRAARYRVAGETVAEVGELHPRLLAELGVPVPAAWAEVDLTALWPLAARRDTR